MSCLEGVTKCLDNLRGAAAASADAGTDAPTRGGRDKAADGGGTGATAGMINGQPAEAVLAQVATMPPEATISTIIAASLEPGVGAAVVEASCRRLRELCRDNAVAKTCDAADAARAVIAGLRASPGHAGVQLQGLAALVNLCAGEAPEPRQRAVDAGALGATIDAMRGAGASLEVQEMAFIALQNGCYGEDELAVSRREVAVQGGALAIVVDIMKRHGADAAQQAAWPTLHEAGVATLRVLVHNVQGARQQALDLGAEADWVRPIKPAKGATSSRTGGLLRGFGTSRTKASLAKIKTND